MRRPEQSRGEDQVDEERHDDARGDEDLGGEREPDVGRGGGPCDAQDAGDDARDGEAEEHAGHDELLAAPAVGAEDGEVGWGGEEEEDEEDAGDGDVWDGRRDEARDGVEGGIGW